MPEFVIHQSTFERLQRHAKPLVDTMDMVVNRALDALENSKEIASDRVNSSDSVRMIDPQNLPDLMHTKVLDAILGENRIVNPNWNSLVRRILTLAMKQYPDFNELQKFCPVNMVEGCKKNSGFRYLPDIDVSFQGMPAKEASRAIVFIADKLKLKIEINIMWRHKLDAAYPGERACLKC